MLIRTNVSKIGDPFILTANGRYYMYATTFTTDGFIVRQSTDLETWEELGVCLDLSNSWCHKDYWAPEVIYHNKKYVMHYTSRRKSDESLRIGVAVADRPEGPFREIRDGAMFDLGYAAIDGHVFIDDDKTPYFYFSKDCSENMVDGQHTSQIMVGKLNDDLTELIGDVKMISTPTEEFEGAKDFWRWNEGPFVIKRNGKYLLFYSANYFESEKYCTCLSVADSPTGEFKKGDKPFLSYRDCEQDFSGSGHCAIFTDLKGNLKMTFHIHTDYKNPSYDRKACVCDLVEEGGKIVAKL